MRKLTAAILGLACGVAGSVLAVAPVHADNLYALSPSQRIACVRGLSPGKLQTSTCRSYAYLFNTKTSEYYRCNAAMTVTKDNKDLMKIDTEGNCQKRPRLFNDDSSYSFDAAETEGPSTNAFFGPGGYAVWASDNGKLAAKACFIISVGGKDGDVSRCIDMKFE